MPIKIILECDVCGDTWCIPLPSESWFQCEEMFVGDVYDRLPRGWNFESWTLRILCPEHFHTRYEKYPCGINTQRYEEFWEGCVDINT